MAQRKRTIELRWIPMALALAGVLASAQVAWAKGQSQPAEPDYTKGQKLEGGRNYGALGPTGITANIWGQGDGDPTRNTRMLQVREVLKGTPADGVLQKDDVILGVISPLPGGAGKPGARFDSDARKALSAAITEAEKKANGGKLVLNVWRKGKTLPATLALPVKGTYSATAPWECEKTKAIIDVAARYIFEKGLYSKNRDGTPRVRAGISDALDALGLLATGEDQYLPKVRDYARAIAKMSEKLDIKGGAGIGTWAAGYRNIFLTEYYLITKDEQVLPGITALSTYMALGQSGVGTWSHGIAYVHQNGLYGPPSAYGAMNSATVPVVVSLMLAQKGGIKKKEIDDAVARSLKFYRWYVDKGCVPYGDHSPAHYHDNNGKNSMTAVMFDIAGNKEATTYFARMTLASHNQRERGHTGHFFSWQWGALGAARGGPEAAQSFVRNTTWFTELERRADGGSVYQNQLANKDHAKYNNWSTTGSRLLQHCLSRKKLYITGKGGSCIPPITGAELKAAVDAATFNPTGLSVKELLAALGNWSLIVRKQAAVELGKREEDVSKDLIAMLDSPNRFARYGACIGLEYAGRKSGAAVDALLDKLQNDKDMTMRFFAVNALKQPRGRSKPNGLGSTVKKATTALLKLAATYEPDQDPMRKLHNEIANLLFYGGRVQGHQGYFPGGRGTEELDRALLIPALKSFLINPNGGGRSVASGAFDYLSEDDLKQVWGDIYYATKYPAPSGVMFGGGVRAKGMALMAEKGIQEGIPVGVDWALREEGWGNGFRKQQGIPSLLKYGKALERFVQEIDKVLAGWTKANKSKNNQDHAKDFKKRLAEALKKSEPRLKSIKTYIDATPDPVAGEE